MAKTTLPVIEFFKSLQGEGSFTGRRCTFIRLAGCNLGCFWCDSNFSHKDLKEEEVQHLTVDEIVAKAEEFNCSVVEVTGGEPLIHGALAVTLLTRLVERGFLVLLETNGTKDIEPMPDGVHVVMDVKCPSSGHSGKHLPVNFSYLNLADDCKFVCGSREDFDYAVDIIIQYHLFETCNCIFSPVSGMVTLQDLADWVMTDTRLPDTDKIWMQLQMHKLIWGNERER